MRKLFVRRKLPIPEIHVASCGEFKMYTEEKTTLRDIIVYSYGIPELLILGMSLLGLTATLSALTGLISITQNSISGIITQLVISFIADGIALALMVIQKSKSSFASVTAVSVCIKLLVIFMFVLINIAVRFF